MSIAINTLGLKPSVRYFLSGGFWSIMANVITALSSLILATLFANLLPESTYGTYRFLMGASVFLSFFSLSGVPASILQAAAVKNYAYYSRGLRLSFVSSISIFLIGIAAAIYYNINGNSVLALGGLLIAVLVPLHQAYKNIFSFLTGRKLFRHNAYVVCGKSIFVTSACAVSVLWWTQNPAWLFGVFLGSSTIALAIAHTLYKPKEICIETMDTNQKYDRYALNTSIRNLIVGVADKLDIALIFQLLGAADLALYAVADLLPKQIKGFIKIIHSLLLPKYANKEFRHSRIMLAQQTGLLFICLTLVSVAYICIVPIFYKIFFPTYHDAIFLSQIAALAFPAFALFVPLTILKAKFAEKKLYAYNIIMSTSQILLLIFGLFWFGLLGAILARIITRYVNLLSSLYLAWDTLDT